MAMPPAFLCPACRGQLVTVTAGARRCPRDGRVYRLEGGIWRFLLDAEAHIPFLEQYAAVRRGEGWGSDDPAFYRALPFRDLSGRHPQIWRVRATSYRVLLRTVITPLASRLGRPLNVVDLGAGNGWLSYRLSAAGHSPVAVDLSDDLQDGLGALRCYQVELPCVQASFDHLPWDAGAFDLAVFNGSLHYAGDARDALGEALRTVGASGRIVVMDSPIYRRRESGEAMLEERRRDFRDHHGVADDLPQEGYLTPTRLAELARELELRWRTIRPWYGLRWALLPWKARLLRRREPARFHLLVGTRASE